MPAIPTTTPARALNLRVRDELRVLIDRAAALRGTSRSEFMLDAARRAAEEALLDQVYVKVDRQAFDHLAAVFDQPQSGEGYERLMHAKTPWSI